MKRLFLTGVALLAGCGGTMSFSTDASDAGSGADMSAPVATIPGVGPIDASGAPAEVVMTCAGKASQIALKMPCAVGFNILGGDELMTAGYNGTECELAGSPGVVALGLLVPLGTLSQRLNEPVEIPGVLAPSSELELQGEAFKMEAIAGTAVFSQVDPVARAFVGRFLVLNVQWKGNLGGTVDCKLIDGAFWAVAGNFF
jgi:hypothetical protein